jgi:hypothetical protein
VAAQRDKVLGEVGARIGRVAAEYAAANEYDAIFLLGAHTLAYYSRALEVTDIIIRLYDERFPVKAGS